jgi:hypothetical protein
MTIDLQDPPEGLHPLQYARAIVEEALGWPAQKTNLELVGDCIQALEKSHRLTTVRAYKYLLRAIGLAKEQGVAVDRFFFLEGGYTNIRRQKEICGLPLYRRIDWKAVEREQATPEWQAANARLRALLSKVAGRTVMP